MFRIFSVLTVVMAGGNLGYAFYQETGWEGAGLFAILAIVIAASVAALLFSPPNEAEKEEDPESND